MWYSETVTQVLHGCRAAFAFWRQETVDPAEVDINHMNVDRLDVEDAIPPCLRLIDTPQQVQSFREAICGHRAGMFRAFPHVVRVAGPAKLGLASPQISPQNLGGCQDQRDAFLGRGLMKREDSFCESVCVASAEQSNSIDF